MFDIGPFEMLAIAVLAMLVLGPEKLPKLIQDVMRTLRKIREFSDSAKEDIRSELGPEFKDFEFEDLKPKNFVRKHVLNGESDEFGLSDLKELKDDLGLDEIKDSLSLDKKDFSLDNLTKDDEDEVFDADADFDADAKTTKEPAAAVSFAKGRSADSSGRTLVKSTRPPFDADAT